MTNPYENIYELCKWLKANGSGVYRPSAHAATVIEEQESELITLRAENDRMKAKLAALESQAKQLITKACCNAVEKLTELAPNQGWDSGEVVAEMYIRQLSDKPVPADKPAARITEQDAREILSEFEGWDKSQFMQGTYDGWFKAEGRALLNKLNADRKVPEVPAVPDAIEMLRKMAGHLAEHFPPSYHLEVVRGSLVGDAREIIEDYEAAPSHSQQNSVADADRFCDAHCTWRDHHPDCPSHESEQPASPAPDDIDRLVEHAAVLSIGLRDNDTDLPTESWRSLPDHLQKAINEKTEVLDFANSEYDVGN